MLSYISIIEQGGDAPELNRRHSAWQAGILTLNYISIFNMSDEHGTCTHDVSDGYELALCSNVELPLITQHTACEQAEVCRT